MLRGTERRGFLLTYLWIAIGGALGSMARFACSELSVHLFGAAFPWGTLAVNVIGSFVIGFFASFTGPGGAWAASLDARLFITVGICGGFTTFSSFSLQTLALFRGGEAGLALANVAGSVILCLATVWLGHAAGDLVNQARAA